MSASGKPPADLERTPLPPPRVARPAGEAVRRLDRLEWMIQQRAWDAACELADELLSDQRDGWVETGAGQYVGFREAVTRALAELPAEGLSVYRSRVDSLARDWTTRGIAKRDAALLRRVVDQFFFSSAGDDALWALGELELHGGLYAAARALWQRVRPETADELGPAYPDSPITLADVRARLALVSIRSGELHRARRQIDELKHEHADASGRMAGRTGAYADILENLLAEARRRADRAADVASTVRAEYEQVWTAPIAPPKEPQDDAIDFQPQPPVYPVAADGVALYRDGGGLWTLDLSDAAAERLDVSTLPSRGGELGGAAIGLAVAPRRAVAALPPIDREPAQLVGFDLARDGAIMWSRPLSDGALVASAPVVAGSRVFVVESAAVGRAGVTVACYDFWSDAPCWRTPLGSASDSSTPLVASLCLSDGIVLATTDGGIMAALRSDDGAPRWLRTYERLAVADSGGVYHRMRDLRVGRCAATASLVVAAPRDAGKLMAVDVLTGELAWSQSLPAADAFVLGIAGDRVILGGETLWTFDLHTGKPVEGWASESEGGEGQGALAEGTVFWPREDAVWRFDALTGESVGEKISLAEPGGANLVVAAGPQHSAEYIVSAGLTHITAYRRAVGAETTPPRDPE